MATTHHKKGQPFTLLACCVAAASTGAIAQEAVRPETPQPATIQPTVNVQVLSTNNVNGASGDARQSDVIATITPGLNIQAKSANTELQGQWQLKSINYLQSTQKNQVLPVGQLDFKTNVLNKGLGIDARLSSGQVKSSVLSNNSDTLDASNTYTNTQASISPFLNKQLDDLTSLDARATKTWLHSTANGDNLADRPDSQRTEYRFELHRQPTRVGYALDWRAQDNRASGVDESILAQRTGRAHLLYALTPELELGIIGGREFTKVSGERFQDTIRGGEMTWHPDERTRAKVTVEQHFFGKGWQADLSHRSPWLALGYNNQRSAETYASSLGYISAGNTIKDLFDAMLTTRIPDATTRSKAVDDLIASRSLTSQVNAARDIYELQAVLRQSQTARISLMGQRDVLTLIAGFTHTQPLLGNNDILSRAALSNEAYADTQLNHLLTPVHTLSAGLKWARIDYTPLNGTPITARDITWRMALNTALSPQTSTTMGFKRLTSHTSTPTSTNESVVYVGLGHRF
jgi:uncharacterized protein (PEP-CTERM system associated)